MKSVKKAKEKKRSPPPASSPASYVSGELATCFTSSTEKRKAEEEDGLDRLRKLLIEKPPKPPSSLRTKSQRDLFRGIKAARHIVKKQQKNLLFQAEEQNRSISADVKTPEIGAKRKRKNTPEEEKERKERTIFIGNVHMGTTREQVRTAIGLSKEECEKIFFRSLPVHPKFCKNRKAGICSGNIVETKASHNAYAVVKEKQIAERILSQAKVQPIVIEGKTLQLDRCSVEKKFSLYPPNKTIFVGNLPVVLGDDALREAFAAIGRVTAVRIIRDSVTGIGKGCGFVSFAEKKYAKEALALRKPIILEDRQVRIMRTLCEAEVTDSKTKKRERMEKKRAKFAERRKAKKVNGDKAVRRIREKFIRKKKY